MKQPLLAVIREAECIGCTKCIQACPFDAIIGSNKLMHSVIADDCSGCELCVPACPVDCIDLLPAPFQAVSKERLAHYGERVKARKIRLQNEAKPNLLTQTAASAKKSYVEMAIERAKSRDKIKPPQSTRPNPMQQR